MKTDIRSLVRKCIQSLTPYSTARDEYDGGLGVFLDANESPYENGYNRYPDPHQKALKSKISSIKGIDASNLFIGNGSDEAIDDIIRVFCEPRTDNIIAIAPSYGMYKVAAAVNDVELREVQLNQDFSLPVEGLVKASDRNTKVVFICSPNNPTGNVFPREEILELADRIDGILVVDEAYVDFSESDSLIGEIKERPNIVVLQTLSKAWGMAGLRVGLAIADAEVIRYMSQVKYPYNINVATMGIVSDLLEDKVDSNIEEIKKQREEVKVMLSGMKIVRKVYPSDANFLLVSFDDPDAVYAHLVTDGIIVRNRNSVKGCEGCLRITIGLGEENEKMLKSLERYEESNNN